jgi:hypothetical protein
MNATWNIFVRLLDEAETGLSRWLVMDDDGDGDDDFHSKGRPVEVTQ